MVYVKMQGNGKTKVIDEQEYESLIHKENAVTGYGITLFDAEMKAWDNLMELDFKSEWYQDIWD